VNGRKIEWIVENDSYNPQQTAAVVKKLVDRDDVFALVSTLGTVTPSRAAVSRAARRADRQSGWRHMLLNKPTDKNVFGILPMSSEIGESMVDFAVNQGLGAKRIAIFFQNDQFGKDQRDGAVAALKKLNMEPVAEASYVPSDVDVSAQAVAIKQANPEVIILGVIQAWRAVRKGGTAAWVEAEDGRPQHGGRSRRTRSCGR